MDKEIIDRFKRLTGHNLGILAERFGVSRQFIHQAKVNYSLTYRASFAFYLTTIINECIESLKLRIEGLEKLKSEIEKSVTPLSKAMEDKA